MYLDNAASTEIIQPVKDKVLELLEFYGNPSSLHNKGFEAKSIIDNATDIISKKINCHKDEIYYTSGATMSNNMAICGYLNKHKNAIFITSSVEHNDIMMLAEKYNGIIVSVNSDGYINIQELESILEENKNKEILCSFQMANSETGVIQDIKRISKLVHLYNVVLHTDATQYIPYFQIDLNKLNIDMLSMSGQKIGCIKGTGLLYKKNNIDIEPLIYGEQGLIGGTENVIGIGCLGEAFKHLDYNYSDTILKRDMLIKLLDGKLIGTHFNRLPNNINILLKGVDSEKMQYILNANEICVSGGSACSSGSGKPSHVIMAMGYSEEDAKSCIRITLPQNISESEIEYISKIININYKMMKG